MSPTRRSVIKFGLLAGAAAALPVEQAAASLPKWFLEQPVESPPIPFFKVPLRIPPVLKPTSTAGKADVYDIVQKVARVPIVPGLPPTTVWAYNGIVPGPTIHQTQGRDVRVRQHNALSVPISVHLHGGDVPATSDGHPLDLVQPGHTKEYFYPGLHPAAPLWYHDHAIHDTGRNVYMGLAGNFLITDAAEKALHLPGGPFDVSSRFDIPLTIQDRFFLPDGSIVYPRHDALRPLEQGVFGDVILVNGTPRPFMQVARRKYRFRILNGSNARVYRLKLSTGEPLVVIQSDGGLMPHPVPTGDLVIAESERYSVVIDFSQYKIGTKVVLQNVMEDIPGDPFGPEFTRSVMRFDVVGDAPDPSRVPRDLVPVPSDIRPDKAVVRRTFEFARNGGEWTVNHLPYDPHRIDAFPKLGTNEIWTFINGGGGWWHPIHVHLIEFLVLSRTRRPVQAYERGPKDTVLLKSNETVSVAMQWDHFTGLYVMHCHNVEHEDHDMMINIQVVK
jgi:FtsP/CotA-like multicopper oxidase with cupredoxin domain